MNVILFKFFHNSKTKLTCIWISLIILLFLLFEFHLHLKNTSLPVVIQTQSLIAYIYKDTVVYPVRSQTLLVTN